MHPWAALPSGSQVGLAAGSIRRRWEGRGGQGIYSGSLLWAEVGGGCILLLKAAALGMAPSCSYAPLCVLIPHSPS